MFVRVCDVRVETGCRGCDNTTADLLQLVVVAASSRPQDYKGTDTVLKCLLVSSSSLLPWRHLHQVKLEIFGVLSLTDIFLADY